MRLTCCLGLPRSLVDKHRVKSDIGDISGMASHRSLRPVLRSGTISSIHKDYRISGRLRPVKGAPKPCERRVCRPVTLAALPEVRTCQVSSYALTRMCQRDPLPNHALLDQGGACGAAGPASAAGSAFGGPPAARRATLGQAAAINRLIRQDRLVRHAVLLLALITRLPVSQESARYRATGFEAA